MEEKARHELFAPRSAGCPFSHRGLRKSHIVYGFSHIVHRLLCIVHGKICIVHRIFYTGKLEIPCRAQTFRLRLRSCRDTPQAGCEPSLMHRKKGTWVVHGICRLRHGAEKRGGTLCFGRMCLYLSSNSHYFRLRTIHETGFLERERAASLL